MLGFRRRHEGVDGLLGHRVVGIEELAMDGAQALFFLGDQVYSGVAPVAVRPVIPQPDFAEVVAQNTGLPFQGRRHQSFERVPHIEQIGGLVPQVIKSLVKVRHGKMRCIGLSDVDG